MQERGDREKEGDKDMTLLALPLPPMLEVELPEWLASAKAEDLKNLGFIRYSKVTKKSSFIFPLQAKKLVEIELGPIVTQGTLSNPEEIVADNESYGTGETKLFEEPNEDHPDYYLLQEIQKGRTEKIEVPIKAVELLWSIICQKVKAGEETITAVLENGILKSDLEVESVFESGTVSIRPLRKFFRETEPPYSEADMRHAHREFNGNRNRTYRHGGYFPYYRGPIKVLQYLGKVELKPRSNTVKRISSEERLFSERQMIFTRMEE
jgi:hypothetical protein